MKYTLITKKGKVMTFFVKAVAETYQQAYGGVIVTADVLTIKSPEITINA